jgi:hypothetical protein
MPDDPLDELAAMLTTSTEPVRPLVDWPATEAELRLPLPSDYRAFIDRYGAGSVDDVIHIYHPTTGLVLPEQAERHLRLAREDRDEDPEAYPYPLWPEPGGLFPFARTMDRCYFYWRTTDADPDGWSTALTEAHYDWWEHPTGMAAFLVDVLAGRAQYPIFLDDWPKPSYDWEPFPVEG